MKAAEEVALLRRELADLRERVARLEAIYTPPRTTPFPSVPAPPPLGLPLPVMLPTPARYDCGCLPGSSCMSSTCPRRYVGMLTTTCGVAAVGTLMNETRGSA